MIDMRGIATLTIVGLGAIVAMFAMLILWGVDFFMPVPGWVFALTSALCVLVLFIIGQRLE